MTITFNGHRPNYFRAPATENNIPDKSGNGNVTSAQSNLQPTDSFNTENALQAAASSSKDSTSNRVNNLPRPGKRPDTNYEQTTASSKFSKFIRTGTNNGNSSYAPLCRLISKAQHPEVNRVLWNDDWDKRVVDRDPSEIRKGIDQNVEQFGGLESYKELTLEDPYQPINPVCGLSANNLFKLMCEKDVAINPLQLSQNDIKDFSKFIDNLDPTKSTLIMVNDGRLGHKFLINSPQQKEGIKKAFIIQSDLGAGALPPLKVEDWLNKRGDDPVSIKDLRTFLSDDFSKLSAERQKQMLASIFHIDRDPSAVDLTKLNLQPKGKSFFSAMEYDPEQFKRNIESVTSWGNNGVSALRNRPGADK